jgi:hypothetical protein
MNECGKNWYRGENFNDQNEILFLENGYRG